MASVLSSEELSELTGYVRPTKQAEWLKKNGFTFRLNRNAQPKVDRTHYLSKMGVGPSSKSGGPNWSAMSE